MKNSAKTSMKWMLSILTLMITVGCNDAPPQSQSESSTPTESLPADPVGEFKVIAKSFLHNIFTEHNKNVAEQGSDPIRSITSEISSDVQKIDSFISGELRANGTWDTKNEKIGILHGEYEFLFVYLDGNWTPKSGRFFSTSSDGTPMSIPLTVPVMQSGMPNNQ